MLTQINLTNFKCFKEKTAIPLSKFNLFTGVNGAGKSSALQVLLLMRQSVENRPITTELLLNGSCVELGGFDDVRNREVSKRHPINLEFIYNYNNDKYTFDLILNANSDERSLAIAQINMCYEEADEQPLKKAVAFDEAKYSYFDISSKQEINSYVFNFPDLVESIPSFYFTLDSLNFNFEFIHYVSADRIGPTSNHKNVALGLFPNVGSTGEQTVSLLYHLRDQIVAEALCLGEDAMTLFTQTEAWLAEILAPLKLEVTRSPTNILELTIGDFKPANVGFGYSSILPIIVTGLIAKPGDKIIIENPEIHLHPKAQSNLIQFLIKVANTGVQVFIESHSDHIFNAMRIATRNHELSPEDSSVLFFSKNPTNNANEISSIVIDANGKLYKKTDTGEKAKLPKAFFDEWTNAMAKLF